MEDQLAHSIFNRYYRTDLDLLTTGYNRLQQITTDYDRLQQITTVHLKRTKQIFNRQNEQLTDIIFCPEQNSSLFNRYNQYFN